MDSFDFFGVAVEIVKLFVVAVLAYWVGTRFDRRNKLFIERRREYNEVAYEIREALVIARDKANFGGGRISDTQFRKLRNVLNKSKFTSFDASVKRYYGAKENARHDYFGQAIPNDPDELRAAIDELLTFTERKE